MADIKKFLDQSGVSALWSKIAAELVAEEAARNQAIADAIADEVTNRDLAIADVAGDVSDVVADVSALETYVGTIPGTATATDIVGYIQEKTAGIATDTALEELTGRVKDAEDAIDAIEADYLTSTDKTELSNAIAAEATRASGVEAGLETRLATVEGDYLKSADKTELQGNIDAVSSKVTTLIGDDADKSVRTIANEELAKQLIAEGAQESLDTLAEIAAWIQSHPDDASAMNQAIVALQAKVDTGDKTVSAYVADAITALSIGDYAKAADLTALAGRVKTIEDDYLKGEDKTELSNAIALKADQTALESEVTRAQAAEKANADAITAEESRAKLAEKANSDAIAAIKDDANIDSFADVVAALAGKQDTIPENTYDAYGAAASAEAAAKSYSDSNLATAKAYTDTEIAKIQALSVEEIEAAITAASTTA